MQINNITVIDRNARPSVLSKVALRTFFVNDGAFTDPYAISSVSIYNKLDNVSPDNLFETSSGQIASGAHSTALMVFAPSGGTNPSAATTGETTAQREEAVVVAIDGVITEQFKPGNYTGALGTIDLDDEDGGAEAGICSGVSGVYRLGTGEYAVVLDGGIALSGVRHDGEDGNASNKGPGVITPNKASGAGNYLDVWTVKLTSTSPWTTYVNEFRLYDDTFYTLTEPLLLRTANRLSNKRATLGSKVDLKITTEMTVENKNIDQNIKNIMKDVGLLNTAVKIEKVNEGSNLPSRVTVSSFDDTTDLVDVTADNTIVLNWDTQEIANLGSSTTEKQKREEIGSPKGTYYITTQYDVLNQKIISNPMPIIIT